MLIAFSIGVALIASAVPDHAPETPKRVQSTLQPGPVRAAQTGAICPSLTDALLLYALFDQDDTQGITKRGLGGKCMRFDAASKLLLLGFSQGHPDFALLSADNGVGVEEGWARIDYLQP